MKVHLSLLTRRILSIVFIASFMVGTPNPVNVQAIRTANPNPIENRLTRSTSPGGVQENYSYDAVGNLVGLTYAHNQTIDWSYDAANRASQKQVAGSPTVNYSYDNLDQVTSNSDGALVMNFSYLADTQGLPPEQLPLQAEPAMPPDPAPLPEAPVAVPQQLSNPGPYYENRVAANGAQAPSSSNVGGLISTDTTWTLAGSPYLATSSVTVAAGATLTIEAGVEVKFNQPTGLTINGRLMAMGTPAKPITLVGTTAQRGWWAGLKFAGTAASPLTGSTLSYVTVSDGGYYSSQPADIYLDYAQVTISNATIQNSKYSGVYGSTGGLADISNTTLTGNGVGSTGETYAIWFNDGSVNPNLASLSVNGNASDAIAFGGGSLTTRTWKSMGVPYVFTGSQTVVAGATLTVEPGVVAQFQQPRGLTVNGTLLANGSVLKPISFVGTTAQRGWWAGLYFAGTAAAPLTGSTLSYVTVSDGGKYITQPADITLYYAQVTISNATIQNSKYSGVYGSSGGLADISSTTLTGNGVGDTEETYPIWFTDGSVNPNLASLSVNGNARDAIAFGGGSLTTRTWKSLGVPYVFTGSQTVVAGATLTVEPGVVARFQQSAGLSVYGTLLANGSVLKPISFVGTTAQRGWWAGIDFAGTAAAPLTGSTLSYVTVSDGGNYISQPADIYLFHAQVTISNATIQNSKYSGVYGSSGCLADISNTTLTGNGVGDTEETYPIWFTDGSVNPNLASLSVNGNASDAIAFGGGSLTTRTWKSLGVPYVFTGSQTVLAGATLTVEPGVVAQFQQPRGLTVNGTLLAIGSSLKPILFTGTTAAPGWWAGVDIEGYGNSTTLATASFEFVTIEYGGSSVPGSNLLINHGQVQMRHSIVRHSSNDGIRNVRYGFSRTLIETSQIVDNAAFGLNNLEPTWAILANNNWWGDPSGPQLPPGSGCGPGGSGNKISDGVIINPVLASPTALAGSPPADSMRLISIKPLRWFVPATGVDRLYVEITLRDGKGVPIPGQTVGMVSTLGTVVAGGVTGFDGKTLAYVRSSTAGDAELIANLNSGACALARSPTALVTFTPATADEGYLPSSQAPYLNTGIQITPMPVVQGVPTQLSIPVTNPNNFPIIIDGSFYYVQTSIGLTFGPLAEVLGTQIPAKGQALIQTMWVPPLSGKYCIQFEYTVRSVGGELQAQQGGRSSRLNLNTPPGPKHSPEVQNAYDSSRKAVSALGDGSDGLTLIIYPSGFVGGALPGMMFGHIVSTDYFMMDKNDKALTGDPPRQDFTIISLPQAVNFTPLQAGPGVSQAKADAANARMVAALDVFSNLRAAALANDRYGGASQAKNIQWASLQLGALLYYEQQAALQMPALADSIDQYVAVVLQENPGDIIMTAAIYQAYQDRLQTQGFNSDEIAAAHLLGMTDAEIEEMRQRRLALDPASVAGSVTQRMTNYAITLRTLSYAILNPINSVFSISGSHGMAAQADTLNDHLARLFATDTTILVGNPYTQTETVHLVIRPIDLPPDWLVTVSPSSASLAAGETMTVTVHISAGSPTAQGTVPSFAVEGYVGSDLIGGVAMDIIIPLYTNFDGKLQIYLPLVEKK